MTAQRIDPTIISMQFELTEALLNQILFSMEEQDIEHLLDSRRGVVVDADLIDEDGEYEEDEGDDEGGEAEDAGRYLAIPEWRSADGFRLMEGFAASLRNPIVREELTSALDRGRGVFRAFKDVLSGRPEVERLWFAWKEREMRRAVTDWYDALREEWGLERLGEEPDETDDLLLEDFRFRAAEAGDEEAARRLHEVCLAEVFGGVDQGRRRPRMEDLDPLRADPWPLAGVPGRPALVAETARGDFAAFALAAGAAPMFRLLALEVAPEYRGLGVGEDLLSRMLGACRSFGGRSLVLDLPASSEAFARVLAREGFAPFETRYRIDLDSP